MKLTALLKEFKASMQNKNSCEPVNGFEKSFGLALLSALLIIIISRTQNAVYMIHATNILTLLPQVPHFSQSQHGTQFLQFTWFLKYHLIRMFES